MGLTTTPNVPHEELAIGNLLGLEVEMDGRIILGGGRKVLSPDGKVTLIYGEPPEIEGLRRLAKGEFTEAEKTGASLLRSFISEVNLDRIKEVFDDLPPEHKVHTLDQALLAVDQIIDGKGRRFHMLKRAMEQFNVPEEVRGQIVRKKLARG